jgi:hypothetical protein
VNTGFKMGSGAKNATRHTRRLAVKTKPSKPKGFKAFDALARKLVQIPKAEVTRKEARRKKRGK